MSHCQRLSVFLLSVRYSVARRSILHPISHRIVVISAEARFQRRREVITSRWTKYIDGLRGDWLDGVGSTSRSAASSSDVTTVSRVHRRQTDRQPSYATSAAFRNGQV